MDIFVGSDGLDTNSGLTRALRVKTATRTRSILDAAGPGPHQIFFEGVLGRSAGAFSFSPATLVNHATVSVGGISIRATKELDATAPSPVFVLYKISRAASDWVETAVGSGVWKWANAIESTSDLCRRVVCTDLETAAATMTPEAFDVEFARKEIFELGGAEPLLRLLAGTHEPAFTWCHTTPGYTKTRDVYVASRVNPVDRWNAVSILTTAVTGMNIDSFPKAWVSPEITYIGSDYAAAVSVMNCNESLIEPVIKGYSWFGRAIRADGKIGVMCAKTVLAPYIDPLNPIPFYEYAGGPLGKDLGGADTIGVGVMGPMGTVTLKGRASNNRATYIKDAVHTAFNVSVWNSATGAFVERVTVEDGAVIDFSEHALYGRAFGIFSISTDPTPVRSVKIGAAVVINQKTRSQVLGSNVRWKNTRFLSCRRGELINNHFSVPVALTVSSITKALQAVLTTVEDHGLAQYNTVTFGHRNDMTGMPEISGAQAAVVSVTNAKTVVLEINTSAYAAAATAGKVTRLSTVDKRRTGQAFGVYTTASASVGGYYEITGCYFENPFEELICFEQYGSSRVATDWNFTFTNNVIVTGAHASKVNGNQLLFSEYYSQYAAMDHYRSRMQFHNNVLIGPQRWISAYEAGTIRTYEVDTWLPPAQNSGWAFYDTYEQYIASLR